MPRKHNILLIGLGPHSKRIYINGLRRLGTQPTLIVELASQRANVVSYLQREGLDCALYFIDDRERDNRELSGEVQQALDSLLLRHAITHAIISTEPKAHYAFLQYLITRQVPTLTDKPLTAPVDVANDEEQAWKIKFDYQHLADLAAQYRTPVSVQCQRRYDPRYRWIIEQAQEVIGRYGVPISHIQLTHCDGSWNMPDEFFSRENHPYKYGYGKLFHSGYHFLDLLGTLLCHEVLPMEKRPTDCQVSTSHYSPHDQLFALDESFFIKAMGHRGFSPLYERWRQGEYKPMGELDLLALVEFSRDGHLLTSCSLNLLQSGFSRRAWTQLPHNTYKGNGRVRHESLSMHIGPLMNIQVHSYQAHEIKERDNTAIDHGAAGGLEHFDIHIFRNSDLIGGPPHQMIQGHELCQPHQGQQSFLGFNENARELCLRDFLEGRPNLAPLLSQQPTIDLVTHAYITMCRGRRGEAPFSRFKIGHTVTCLDDNKEANDGPAPLYRRLSS